MDNNALYGEILDLLENDARLSVEDIALMTGVSADRVREAIAHMEQEKIIVKYAAITNREKVASEEEALIGEGRSKEAGATISRRTHIRFDEVKAVYLMSGTYDLSVVIHAKSMKQISNLYLKTGGAGRRSTVTHFIMRNIKSRASS